MQFKNTLFPILSIPFGIFTFTISLQSLKALFPTDVTLYSPIFAGIETETSEPVYFVMVASVPDIVYV